jgi:vitamin B12 transporter
LPCFGDAMSLSLRLLGLIFAVGAAVTLPAQPAPVSLTPVDVVSSRVANQEPVGTVAMPVSALRYEPLVDVQGRNLAEAQADISIRGGIFENTGFNLGAVTISDPQTGHYLAEIPLAPAMLGAPAVVTGADHALGATNSTVAAVRYGWRPIQDTGSLAGGAGDFGFSRFEAYAGQSGLAKVGGASLGADLAWAASSSDGAIAFGEHDFSRVAGRVQLRGAASQTDLAVGYQEKFFGWPNLYTPFNSNETENLQTLLVVANHRTDLGGGDYVEAGAFHRRNKDDYAFNRFTPLGVTHPFQHTAWLSGAAVGGRVARGDWIWNFRAEVSADELKSTSLLLGPPGSRTLSKAGLVPERTWPAADGAYRVKLGATLEGSNHGESVGSPVLEVARDWSAGALRRVHVSYAGSSQLPSYTALKSNPAAGLFRGNPALGRARSQNLEAGADWVLGDWHGQAAVFARRDAGLTDWTFRQGVTARSASPVDIETAGAEVVAMHSWSRVDLVLGGTVLGKSSDYRGAAVDASFYALNFAWTRLTAALTVHLTPEFELRADNEYRHQAANPLRAVGGNDALLSTVALTWRPALSGGLEFSAAIDNLWQDDFQDVPGVPAAPRQGSVGVVARW